MLQGFERHLGDALHLQSALFLLKPDLKPRVRRLRCCTNHRSVFLTTNQSQLLLPAPPLALATSSELSDSPLSTISGVCQPAKPLPRPGPELLVSRVSQFLLVGHLANN